MGGHSEKALDPIAPRKSLAPYRNCLGPNRSPYPYLCRRGRPDRALTTYQPLKSCKLSSLPIPKSIRGNLF
jgi:hypothetical protein